MDSDRSIGFGDGRIPFSAIDRYASRYGVVDADEFDRFASFIRAVDHEYLAIRANKPGSGDGVTVSLSDVDGVKSMLRGLAPQPGAEADLFALKRRMQAEAAKEEGTP